ncbi:uncharacterized protein LOC107884115 [Acyrthosiphon pisum]|uniref:Uncharacterized protein n=1 Tax=Acyrthosiphon pisum TaxID=7029 RepID=A0A8R2NLR5_ACYPI|nr:uncharacterized protein LOC107884115 [Acyrthosiphon pisum]|eukprot:XP_016661096.1 PREDICTED: uncharacterized protein LOC107884115 [Acyrthosiphon pisum]
MEPSLCNAIIEDSETGERLCPSLSSIISINVSPEDNSLLIARGRSIQTEYKLEELVGLYTDDAYPDRVALKFRSHKHNVLLLCSVQTHIQNILSFIHEYIALNDQDHIINNGYKLDMGSFSCMKRYTLEFNFEILSNLVLENVGVRCLIGLENMPHLRSISLSGSELGKTRREKDTFWNWMLLKNIGKSLTILLMDNVDLRVVPFEMRNLTNLETLSMAHNKLKCLPHYFGDLTAMSRLFINDNSISYFPFVLQNRTFIDINIEDNFLRLPREGETPPAYRQKPPIEKRAPEKLAHLALFSLLNNKVQFERKDINRPLWKYFNNISRCRECNKWMVVYLKNAFYEIGFLSTANYQCVANIILWQYAECLYPCKQESHR